jgi:hypothetical protein
VYMVLFNEEYFYSGGFTGTLAACRAHIASLRRSGLLSWGQYLIVKIVDEYDEGGGKV